MSGDPGSYCALIALAGQSIATGRGETVSFNAGDILLPGAGENPTEHAGNGLEGEWLTIHFPRWSLIEHLGPEPTVVRAPRGTPAGQLLVRIAQEAREDTACVRNEPCLQLVVYNLLAALFRQRDAAGASAHTDELFGRVCDIIRGSCTDLDLGPSGVAEEAGVSLRYLQKLFSTRGTTCSHFILAVRLDLALRHIRQRNLTKTGQSLSQIAYACGFRDYHYFSRAFRQRFGCAPGSTSV